MGKARNFRDVTFHEMCGREAGFENHYHDLGTKYAILYLLRQQNKIGNIYYKWSLPHNRGELKR